MPHSRLASLVAGTAALSMTLAAAAAPTDVIPPGTPAAPAEVDMSTAGARDAAAIDLDARRAIWLGERTLAVDVAVEDLAAGRHALLAAPEGGIAVEDGRIAGAEQEVELTPAGEMSEEQAAEHPRYADYATLALPRRADVEDLLRGQLVLVERDADGEVQAATGVQIAGALDAVYAEAADEQLGLTWKNKKPELALWAPTARSVELELYSSPEAAPERHRMKRDRRTGVWSVKGKKDWDGAYYTYSVEVWHPATGEVETHSVTDPHSIALAADSTHSQIVDLDDPALTPEGWGEDRRPEGVEPSAAQIWEVHVRDFSVADETIPEELRGTYSAFTESDSTSVGHLQDLAEAGLTHVHLLPTFDIASVPETEQATPDCELSSFGPTSTEQQSCLAEVRGEDAYNWGYDPLHFNVPEGSYATDPDGAQRILEYRRMVMALHEMGLRVVNDVVYNHTAASGVDEQSIFDRIVPGYYHRLDEAGSVETSTCCQNTAPERMMYDKFIVESAELWAEEYRVDGLRFDLMGHHPKENILAVQEAVEQIDPGFLLYGEGWDFGEVSGDALFEQATQPNMAGTGIGTFNDRMRDAAHGGGPFDEDPRRQGFGTGLWTQDNGSEINGDDEDQRDGLLQAGDLVKLGLVGNLADYELPTADGVRTGSEIDYNGAPAGYTDQPGESVSYVDAHDNEILFDLLAYKLDHAVEGRDRARMQAMNLSLAMLSQGSGFVTAGTEMMRSKSLDRDSYDSGDWFNAIRWGCGASEAFGPSTTGFGIGMPPAWTSQAKWPYAEETLDAVEAPTCEEVEFSRQRHLEQLEIASSTGAFSLGDAEEVADRVHFPLAGAGETPGVITMTIDLDGLEDSFDQVTVVVNATDEDVEQTVEERAGSAMALHPVLQDSVDEAFDRASVDAETGTFSAPARTTTVFVE